MLSSSTYALLRLAGWTYLPDLLTQTLLRIIYTPHPLSPLPVLCRLVPALFPSPNLKTSHKNPLDRNSTPYRLLLSLILSLYLLSNLIESLRSTSPNFYEILQVHPSVDEAGLKVAFRNFARRYHPDKMQGHDGGEEWFREVRGGFEGLRDPVVRFAYDRFGASVLTWTQCTTMREYLRHGLMQSSGYHIVTGAGLLFFSAIGKPNSVAFWRYLLFACLFASELSLLLSPSPSPLPPYPSSSSIHPPPQPLPILFLSTFFPNRVAYQHILFLHQLFMFLSIGLSRVVPVLTPLVREYMMGQEERVGVVDESGLGQVVDRFGTLVRAADRELYLMLHTELHSVQPPSPQPPSHPHSSINTPIHHRHRSPFKPITAPSEAVMNTLTNEMQNMMIENKLRKEAPLRSAWEAAIERGFMRERALSVGVGDTREMGEKLTSPVSPFEKPGQESRVGVGVGKLPSPRPSPPPAGLLRRGSSYVRARSVSC